MRFITPNFPNFKQLDASDCGPACIKIIAEFYGKEINFLDIKKHSYINKKGVSFSGLIAAANFVHLTPSPLWLSLNELLEQVNLPCIIHWEGNHFVVVYKIYNNKVYISDPRKGLCKYGVEEFKKKWISKNGHGAALLLETTREFFFQSNSPKKKANNLIFLKDYFKPHYKLIFQVILGILVSSILQLCLPFLTKNLVDYGINNKDYSFVLVVVVFQLVFILSLFGIQIFQSWIILHVTTKINIELIFSFLTKLLKLPVSYFQSLQEGDFLQRINDHDRIKRFLSASSLAALLGVINLILFTTILAYFNKHIAFVFIIGSFIYLVWVSVFFKKRALLDDLIFEQKSLNQTSLLQIFNGINEIKINGSYERRKNAWKKIQYNIFNVSTKSLLLNQKQLYGGGIINQAKNILIILVAAKLVIDGVLSLGALLAIQFIIGRLDKPLKDIVTFVFNLQDANLSIKRLTEIHNTLDEELGFISLGEKINQDMSISFDNVSFGYNPFNGRDILQNISVTIPKGKTTAIVGPSGSGKSTFLKLLLRFIEPTKGNIYIDKIDLNNFNILDFRSKCGVVMQDGFIFNDSLENNITESNNNEHVDLKQLNLAIDISNLKDLVDNLPNGIKTMLGVNGSVLSGGEKQRILIARAVYKNPKFVFFDEATSNLDSTNEYNINRKLKTFFNDKTVVVIAHRLSTIVDANQIIVLKRGKIVEVGSHKELLLLKNEYFKLIKNQIEL